MIMNSQYHPVYGEAPVMPNAPYAYGANPNPPYGANANPPYGMNQPYEQSAVLHTTNIPYGATTNPPYGANVNPPYGMNQPYEQSAVLHTTNIPYGATTNPPYGANANPPYEMNQPYEQSAVLHTTNIPYGATTNPPYGANANAPYGVNLPYGATMNAPYGANANPSYGATVNPSYGVSANPPYEIALSYGANLPCEVNPPYGRVSVGGLPAVYGPTWQQGIIEPYPGRYRFAPNNPKHAEGGAKEGIRQLLLFSIAGVIIAAFLAIMIGIAIHDDGTEMNMSEAFASWMGGRPSESEEEEAPPAAGFLTESAGTVRGEMFAVGEDGSIFLRTQYGICRVGKDGNRYEYNGWAAELDPDIKVRTMAVYGDYLYLACGENGIYRVNTARSNTLTQIIDDHVVSFVIAEDHLFYLSMEYQTASNAVGSNDNYYGELYIAGLNGRQSRSLGEKVRFVSKYLSSADFIFVNGYLYFFDDEMNLKRMRADGTRSSVVVERERQKPSFEGGGLYENGGILYFPSLSGGGIYAYDIEADKLKKISDAQLSFRSPILFAGDALLYREMACEWHQIKDGQDTVYQSPLNDTGLWMQAVGKEELFLFYESRDGNDTQSSYHAVSFSYGKIRSEQPVVIDYDTMPEVEIEEDPSGLLQGSGEAAYRASHWILVGPNGLSACESYLIVKVESDWWDASGDNVGLIWMYTDGDGEHTEWLVDGEVGTFFVEEDILYYTLRDEGTERESYALYYKELLVETGENLIAEGVRKEFEYGNGMIYYSDADDGTLYRYLTLSEQSMQISEDKVGCYDIYDGMIYYENISDSTIWRMRPDGSEAEPLLSFGGVLCQLTVCPYDGGIYFAVVIMENRYEEDGLYLLSEDGQTELLLSSDLGDFDRRQTLYYRDGRLYYSASIAYEIHMFDFEEYFDGGSGIRANHEAYDSIFCSENMNTFEVTDEWVFVQMFQKDTIKVFDRQTGELLAEIDYWEFLGELWDS